MCDRACGGTCTLNAELDTGEFNSAVMMLCLTADIEALHSSTHFHMMCHSECCTTNGTSSIDCVHHAAALGMRLMGASKQLIAALLPLTTHKRHRVRVAAIQAINRVTHQVGSCVVRTARTLTAECWWGCCMPGCLSHPPHLMCSLLLKLC